jgi:hypothetical protein
MEVLHCLCDMRWEDGRQQFPSYWVHGEWQLVVNTTKQEEW